MRRHNADKVLSVSHGPMPCRSGFRKPERRLSFATSSVVSLQKDKITSGHGCDSSFCRTGHHRTCVHSGRLLSSQLRPTSSIGLIIPHMSHDMHSLVCVATECRSQAEFGAVVRFIHSTRYLLRSRSLFAHHCRPFPSREIGYRHRILAAASDFKAVPF